MKIVLLRICLGGDGLFIIHLIVNITSSREEGEGQEQQQGNAHVHPAPRIVFISVSSSNLQNTYVSRCYRVHMVRMCSIFILQALFQSA
jgi:hypothetical protein